MRNPQYGGKPLKDWDTRMRESMISHEHRKGDVKRMFIYKNQLMLDIDSNISILVRSRNTDNIGPLDDMTEKYKAQFDRWIDKYVDKVKERLIIGLLDRYNESMGDDLRDWSEKELVFRFPDWWDDTAWKPLVSCVHDYIVNAVVWEFCKISITATDAVTKSKEEDMEESWRKMRTLQTMKKPGSVKKALNPMGF